MSGLYIHIPFCHSKCAYCDFFSTPRGYDTDAYVSALIGELKARKDEVENPFTTIYIGGGTPSSLPIPTLERLVKSLPSESAEEFTIEVNPEDVTQEFLHWLRDSPLSRVSMGVQSFTDSELKAVGRRHTSARAREALGDLMATGMNVSADLIYGLPLQTVESWEKSLNELLEFRPQHISCYVLSYEPGTALTSRLRAGKVKECGEAELCEMYAALCQQTAAYGYEHYEIANFALKGYRSRHNSSYWAFTPYLGLGTGAHSFDGRLRRVNPPDIAGYISQKGKDFFEVEDETPREQANDFIMVRLRTSDGLDMNELRRRFGATVADKALATACRLVEEKRLEYTGTDRFRIPETDWLTADSVILELIEV